MGCSYDRAAPHNGIKGIVLALGPATGVALGVLAWWMRLWHVVELLQQREEPGEHGMICFGFFVAERKVIALRQTLEIVTRGDTQCHRCAPLVARGCPVSPWGLGPINPPASSYHRPPPGDRQARSRSPRLQLLPNATLQARLKAGVRHERALTAVACKRFIGIQSCFQ